MEAATTAVEAGTVEPAMAPAAVPPAARPPTATAPPSAPTPADVDPDRLPVIRVTIIGIVRIIRVVRVGRRISIAGLRVSVAGGVLRRRGTRCRRDHNGDGRNSGRGSGHSPEPALLGVNEHGHLHSGRPSSL